MTHFWEKWKKVFSKHPGEPLAQLNLKVYANRLEFGMTGNENIVGGALVTLMLHHEHIRAIINNALEVTNKELARCHYDAVRADLLTTKNLN